MTTPPEPAPARSRGGPVTLLLAVLLVLVAHLPFVATLALYTMYSRQIMQEEELNAKKVAELLLKSFEQTIDSADALLLNFASSYDSDWTPAEIALSLKSFRLPRSIVQFGVVDKTGIMIANNIAPPGTSMVDLSNREHIRVHMERAPAQGGLFISKPVFGRVSQRWVIQLTRPLADAHGDFAGVVVASYAIADFIEFYKTLRIDDDMLIGLVGFDGIIRARAARQTSFGDDISQSPAFNHAMASKESVYEFPSPLDGVERLGYMIQSDRYPFYVTVAYSLDFIREHMSEFRAAILGTGIALGVVLLLLGLLAGRYLSIQKRLDARDMEALARQRETDVLNAISRVPGVSVMHLTAAGPVEIGAPGEERQSQLMRTYLASARFQALAARIEEPVVRSEHLTAGVEEFELEMVIAPLKTMAGQRGSGGKELVIFAVDQTSRRMEENKLYQMLKLASLGEVATGLAHEINQPLGVIRLAASNALTGARLGLPVEHLMSKLDRIIQQTERMGRIIDHMRIFGRKSDDRLQPCRPSDAVDGALQVVGVHFRLDNITVTTQLAHTLPKVLCRQDQLEQVLINLLQNARDAVMEKRRKADADVPGRIRIEAGIEAAADAQGTVRIDVSDNGGGIPADIIDRVFQPFFTTKPPGKGTGLGLSVSFGIIRDHGGSLSVRNGPDGAIFSIRLPAEAERDAPEPHEG
ncbi:ATP-binding protein [Xanthobacter sediminis]